MNGISVVIPMYNEEGNVAQLCREVTEVLGEMDTDYEVIFVDDGSQDATLEKLRQYAGADPHTRIVELRRNFGQTAALAAGFDEVLFDVVVTLDGDLQNDPRDIPRMVAKLDEGYDLVAGWRKDRKDAFWHRILPSLIANRLISRFINVRLHDYGCTLKAMTKEITDGIQLYGEMHRFIPALAVEMGASVTEIPVNHRPRTAGTSKYGLSRVVRVILDLVTVKFLLGYSTRPIHLFGTLGLITGFIGTAALSVITFERLFLGVDMGSRPVLPLSVMLIMIGLQFLVFGLLAEVLARTYYESQNKEIYVIRNVIDHCAPADDDGRPGDDPSAPEDGSAPSRVEERNDAGVTAETDAESVAEAPTAPE